MTEAKEEAIRAENVSLVASAIFSAAVITNNKALTETVSAFI